MNNEATSRIQMYGGEARLYRCKYELEVVAGPDLGKKLSTAQESTTVGSARWNDLVLGNPAVSRHHLRIKITEEGFLLTDLDSTNGTMVGNLRVRQCLLRGPVDLRLGDTVLRFNPLAQEEEILLPADDSFGLLVGESAPMRELFRKLQKIAPQETTVLIEGETGTGKEVIAREIHAHSPRAKGPFVVVDCGAIPPELIESELFGHAAGAFTGATEDRAGPFEEADGGTVFLDEIGELVPELQPKLLRVLERREIKRVGEHTPRNVSVRIIAATNRDLLRAVNQQTFRPDLFYRLAVAHLTVPPLRQRGEDLDRLIEQLWPEVSGGASDAPLLDAAMTQRLRTHSWPGNVRELRNVLERLAVFAGGWDDLDPLADLTLDAEQDQLSLDELDQLSFRDARAEFEQRYISRLLVRCNFNVAEAARQSGIDRVHLYRLIKKHRIRRQGGAPP